MVAPHAGAWIEINIRNAIGLLQYVAPHAGAWIEIWIVEKKISREEVAPHAGAWIEIRPKICFYDLNTSRTPCGCVD